MGNNINIYLLKASDRIGPYLKLINETTERSIRKINVKIPLSNIDIVLYDNPLTIIKEIGIGGFAVRDHTILVSFDPRLPAMKNIITEELPRTLAHELHHIVRRRSIGSKYTLLDVLVLEGLADHFDIEVFGQLPHPWSRAVLYKEKKSLIDLVKKEYNNKCDRKVYKEWFLGWGSRGIPRWSGYTVGFEIVKKYLKTYKKSKPSTLYNKDTKDFIDALKSL